jgi:hypothetical protein
MACARNPAAASVRRSPGDTVCLKRRRLYCIAPLRSSPMTATDLSGDALATFLPVRLVFESTKMICAGRSIPPTICCRVPRRLRKIRHKSRTSPFPRRLASPLQPKLPHNLNGRRYPSWPAQNPAAQLHACRRPGRRTGFEVRQGYVVRPSSQ